MTERVLHADGRRVLSASGDGTVRVRTVEREGRSPSEIAAFARCHVPLRIEDSRLVLAALTCAP